MIWDVCLLDGTGVLLDVADDITDAVEDLIAKMPSSSMS